MKRENDALLASGKSIAATEASITATEVEVSRAGDVLKAKQAVLQEASNSIKALK